VLALEVFLADVYDLGRVFADVGGALTDGARLPAPADPGPSVSRPWSGPPRLAGTACRR